MMNIQNFCTLLELQLTINQAMISKTFPPHSLANTKPNLYDILFYVPGCFALILFTVLFPHTVNYEKWPLAALYTDCTAK